MSLAGVKRLRKIVEKQVRKMSDWKLKRHKGQLVRRKRQGHPWSDYHSDY